MKDLLALRQLDPPAGRDEDPAGPPVLVVASGKGGVGKSVLAVLLAESCAAMGQRVLLFDGSQNLGHLHVLLGVTPERHLEEVVRGEVEPRDLLLPVTDSLWLVPSDSGAEALYALPVIDQARLHHRLSALYRGFDLVVVDAGAGVEGAIRLATMGGSRLLVVTAPEVAALTDAYALIKLVLAQLPVLPIDVIVNRVVEPDDLSAAFERLSTAVARFLGRSLTLVGGVAESAPLRDAVRRPGALLTEPTLAPTRAEMTALATVLLTSLAAADPVATGRSL